jgi:hypothetical protein
MRRIAELIDAVLGRPDDDAAARRVAGPVRELARSFPLYAVAEAATAR